MTSKETIVQIFKTDERHQGTDLSGHIFRLLKQDKHKETTFRNTVRFGVK